jgi:putative endonuclease
MRLLQCALAVIARHCDIHYFEFMIRGGCIYILTNKNRTTLYVGITSDLYSRVIEHREKIYPKSFTARYNLSILVYYEPFNSIEEAIDREKQIKAGSRAKKEELINSINQEWRDLFPEVEKW